MSGLVSRFRACVVPVFVLFGATLAARAEDPVIPGSVLVRLRPGADIDVVRARHQFPQIVRSIPARGIYELSPPAGVSDESLEAALQPEQDADSLWAELNYFGDAPEASGRNFFLNEVSSPIPFLNQLAWTNIDVGGAQAVSRGAGVLVAVVDSGVDGAHPLLAGRIDPNGWNYVAAWPGDATVADSGNNLDDDGDGDIDEIVGHGTHVASIVAHVAPEATILPVRILNSDGDTDIFLIAAGIFYAIDHGADVINLSVGTTYDSDAIEDAIREATAVGIVTVAAAGNVNTEQPEEYPAMLENVISVAAVNDQDVRAPFSNYHPALTLTAPGVAVYGGIPGDEYAQWDGTSFATPMVSGAAALLLAHHGEWLPNANRVELAAGYLRASAVNIDAQNPAHVGLLGAGRLDAGAALALEVLVATTTTLPSGGIAPSAIVSTDLDGDLYADLVVANEGSSQLAVLRNQRDGTFAAPVTYATPGGPSDVDSGDFDADGRPDVVVLCNGASQVVVFRNTGGGALVQTASRGSPSSPQALVAADFSGDGRADVAVAGQSSNVVAVYLSDSTGGLLAPQSVPVAGRPRDVAAGDVDHDGDVDLATANRDGSTAAVLRNNGAGLFALTNTLPTGAEPRGVLVRDLDADGSADIVTMNVDSQNLSVFWNNGSGGFGAATPIPLPLNADPSVIVAARLNCDDTPDLIVLNGDAGAASVDWLRNDGARGLAGPLQLGTPPGADAAAASDLDADSDTELVVVDRSGGQVTIYWNQSCTPPTAGDTNCDARIDFFDVDPFILAIFAPESYTQVFPGCLLSSADVNGDTRVNFLDIDPFIGVLFR